MFCQFKNALGKPSQGAHRFRIFNLAIVDVGLTVLLAIILAAKCRIRMTTAMLVLVFLGILAHRIFCVRTTVDRLLFGSRA